MFTSLIAVVLRLAAVVGSQVLKNFLLFCDASQQCCKTARTGLAVFVTTRQLLSTGSLRSISASCAAVYRYIAVLVEMGQR
jgi:hypothetical protein